MSIRRLGWIAAVALWSGWGCASSSLTSALPSNSCQVGCDTPYATSSAGPHFSKPHYASQRHALRGVLHRNANPVAENTEQLDAISAPVASPLPTLNATAPYEIYFPAAQRTFSATNISQQTSETFLWDTAEFQDVICRAARHAAVANAIASQREWFRGCDTDRCSRQEVDDLFSLAEQRERQLAAEKAATLVINAGRIQCQQVLLHEVRDEIQRILGTLDQLAEIQSDAADSYTLKLQLLELDEQQATLTARQIEIQSRLRQLLALPPNDHRPLRISGLPEWTSATISDDLVAVALDNRPDLRATRQLAEIDTLGLNIDLSSQMAGIHPLLAVRLLAEASETPVLDFLAGKDQETDPRCEPRLQGRNLEQEQVRDITAEVITIEGELHRCDERIRAIADRIDLLTNKRNQLESELKIGRVNYQQWIEVSLGRLKARGELIDATCDLQAQLVKLETATGTISVDCDTTALSEAAVATSIVPVTNSNQTAIDDRLAHLRSMGSRQVQISRLTRYGESMPRLSSGELVKSSDPATTETPSMLSNSNSQRRAGDSSRPAFLPNVTAPRVSRTGVERANLNRQTDYEAPQASLAPIRLMPAAETSAIRQVANLRARPEPPSVVQRAPSEPGPRRLRLSPMPAESPASREPNK